MTHLTGGYFINHFDLLPLLIVSPHQDRNNHILVHSCEQQAAFYFLEWKTFHSILTIQTKGHLSGNMSGHRHTHTYLYFQWHSEELKHHCWHWSWGTGWLFRNTWALAFPSPKRNTQAQTSHKSVWCKPPAIQNCRDFYMVPRDELILTITVSSSGSFLSMIFLKNFLKMDIFPCLEVFVVVAGEEKRKWIS